MKKTILNIALLGLLSMPCLLTLNEPHPLTGEFNWWVNLIGLGYSAWFFGFVKKIFKHVQL